MAKTGAAVAEHFEDAAQQHEAATLGMWTFLATEVLFFGGLFLAYILFRNTYSEAFAQGSRETNLFFGTLNTAILLTSSWTMALAVHDVTHLERGRRPSPSHWLWLSVALALGFLVVKGFEYHEDIVKNLVPGPGFNPEAPPRVELFFWLYWAMTGLHALHVTVGVGLLGVVAVQARNHASYPALATRVEMTGLYWHFVDLVWIFLYPLLYLIDRQP